MNGISSMISYVTFGYWNNGTSTENAETSSSPITNQNSNEMNIPSPGSDTVLVPNAVEFSSPTSSDGDAELRSEIDIKQNGCWKVTVLKKDTSNVSPNSKVKLESELKESEASFVNVPDTRVKIEEYSKRILNLCNSKKTAPERVAKILHDLSILLEMNNDITSVIRKIDKEFAEKHLNNPSTKVGLLNRAISKKNLPLSMYLIDNGSDLHFSSNKEESTLHLACEYLPDIVPRLLKNGAEVIVYNENASRPIDILREKHIEPLTKRQSLGKLTTVDQNWLSRLREIEDILNAKMLPKALEAIVE